MTSDDSQPWHQDISHSVKAGNDDGLKYPRLITNKYIWPSCQSMVAQDLKAKHLHSGAMIAWIR